MINNLLWEEILQEAIRRGVPVTKKRAIIREYLQVKFLTGLYRLPGCQNLAFIGGTSLRLLRGLDRFSEDLDFDNFGLSPVKTKVLFAKASREFKREEVACDFDFKISGKGGQGRLKISTNPKEKLMVRLDFTFQPRIETEVLLLSEFGLSERIVTNTLPVLLSQKFRALITRKDTRGRDFYDLYWLLARGIKPNLIVLKPIGIKSKEEFREKLIDFCQKKEKKMAFFQKQLKPFLLNEENQRFIGFLKDFRF